MVLPRRFNKILDVVFPPLHRGDQQNSKIASQRAALQTMGMVGLMVFFSRLVLSELTLIFAVYSLNTVVLYIATVLVFRAGKLQVYAMDADQHDLVVFRPIFILLS